MRAYAKPPKAVDVQLPNTLSDEFVTELQAILNGMGEDFKTTYLKSNLLSKYCDSRTTPASVRKENAIAKWLSIEKKNAVTNVRLYSQKEKSFGWTTYSRLCVRVKRRIASILGPLPYPSVILDVTHTNGASTRVRRSFQAALLKLEGVAHVSATALPHWVECAKDTRLELQTVEQVESSVLFTVPKKSDIDRVACKEPEINMLLQRSVGQHIRRRLRDVGVNLNDQRVNQELSRVAVSRGLATIDLSSASDSISRQLVFDLLPFEWWSLLDDLRVKSTLIGQNQQLHELEMFSSMGNGFTFELESLLFYAITRTVCEMSRVRGRISVYGDDIIAPCAVVPRLIRVFHFIGFKTNAEKTFFRGNFRESCGKHWYGGFDVSPFFVRRRVSQLPDLINLLNQLLQWDGRGYGFFTTPQLAEFHRKFSQYVPEYFYGGVDPDDATRLVTGHAPRYGLIPRKKEAARLENAALTHWFMVKESVQDLPELDVELSYAQGFKASRSKRGWLTSWKPYAILQGA